MALLTQVEALALREAPANREALSLNSRHDERLRMHAVPVDSAEDAGNELKEHYKRVNVMLSGKKFEKYKALTPFPLPSTELVDEIIKELRRALFAQNRVISAQFREPETAADWQEYRGQVLKDESFFAEEGMRAAAGEVHSWLIADLPGTPPAAGARPAPFGYLVPAEYIVDARIKDDGQAEYIIFYPEAGRKGKDRIVVLDDAFYRVFALVDNAWTNVAENPHALGYCPARMFWSEALSQKWPLRRRGPLSTVLGSLDDFLFYFISDKYVETYVPYPIVWEIGDTTPKNHVNGDNVACINGRFHYTKTTEETLDDGQKIVRPVTMDYACAECAAGSNTAGGGFGPGSSKTIKIPSTATNASAFREPVGFTSPPVEALKFISGRVDEKRVNIFTSVVGFSGEKTTDQPRNEQDVRSNFEGRINALVRFKANLEKAHRWLLETCAKLRYGAEFESLILSYGDIFYLKDEATLEREYAEAIKAGLPVTDIMQKAAALDAVRSRGNPEQALRLQILRELEPYLALTPAQLVTLGTTGLGASVLQRLKLNFYAYVAEFEREELPVTRFGKLLPWRQKIAIIFKQLLEYAKRDERERGGQSPVNPQTGEHPGKESGAGNGTGNPTDAGTGPDNGNGSGAE